MDKIKAGPLNTSSGGEMKKRLQNAYIRGSKVYIDYTLTAVQAKELRARGAPVEAKRYRLATDKAATSLNLKWVNENPLKVIENLLSQVINDKLKISVYGLKCLELGSVYRKPVTQEMYIRTFYKYVVPEFGELEPDEIRPSDIALWQKKIMDQGLSASSMTLIRATLQVIMRVALDDDIINKNPFISVRPPRITRQEVEAYTLDEIRLLLDNAEGWFKNALTLMFFTGMRTGEMMALKWEDINFHSRKIHISKTISHGRVGIPKTNKTRTIDMLPQVEAALREQYRHTGLKGDVIFTGSRTRDMDGFKHSQTLTITYWRPLIKRCGLHYIDFYNTRHTFASIMLSYGESAKWVSNMLGHSSIMTTERFYSKFINDKSIERATFLQDMGFGTQLGTTLAQTAKNQNLKKGA
jgi:integrase